MSHFPRHDLTSPGKEAAADTQQQKQQQKAKLFGVEMSFKTRTEEAAEQQQQQNTGERNQQLQSDGRPRANSASAKVSHFTAPSFAQRQSNEQQHVSANLSVRTGDENAAPSAATGDGNNSASGSNWASFKKLGGNSNSMANNGVTHTFVSPISHDSRISLQQTNSLQDTLSSLLKAVISLSEDSKVLRSEVQANYAQHKKFATRMEQQVSDLRITLREDYVPKKELNEWRYDDHRKVDKTAAEIAALSEGIARDHGVLMQRATAQDKALRDFGTEVRVLKEYAVTESRMDKRTDEISAAMREEVDALRKDLNKQKSDANGAMAPISAKLSEAEEKLDATTKDLGTLSKTFSQHSEEANSAVAELQQGAAEARRNVSQLASQVDHNHTSTTTTTNELERRLSDAEEKLTTNSHKREALAAKMEQEAAMKFSIIDVKLTGAEERVRRLENDNSDLTTQVAAVNGVLNEVEEGSKKLEKKFAGAFAAQAQEISARIDKTSGDTMDKVKQVMSETTEALIRSVEEKFDEKQSLLLSKTNDCVKETLSEFETTFKMEETKRQDLRNDALLEKTKTEITQLETSLKNDARHTQKQVSVVAEQLKALSTKFTDQQQDASQKYQTSSQVEGTSLRIAIACAKDTSKLLEQQLVKQFTQWLSELAVDTLGNVLVLQTALGVQPNRVPREVLDKALSQLRCSCDQPQVQGEEGTKKHEAAGGLRCSSRFADLFLPALDERDALKRNNESKTEDEEATSAAAIQYVQSLPWYLQRQQSQQQQQQITTNASEADRGAKNQPQITPTGSQMAFLSPPRNLTPRANATVGASSSSQRASAGMEVAEISVTSHVWKCLVDACFPPEQIEHGPSSSSFLSPGEREQLLIGCASASFQRIVLVVTRLEHRGPAQTAGLRHGDVIVQLGKHSNNIASSQSSSSCFAPTKADYDAWLVHCRPFTSVAVGFVTTSSAVISNVSLLDAADDAEKRTTRLLLEPETSAAAFIR